MKLERQVRLWVTLCFLNFRVRGDGQPLRGFKQERDTAGFTFIKTVEVAKQMEVGVMGAMLETGK